MKLLTRRSWRSQKGVSELSQFPLVLYVLFLIVLLPLLNLVTLFVAGTTQYLATNDFAAKAATQADYASALNSMANEAFQFQSNGLAQFVHLIPEGGYTGCGDDLYVLATNIANGTVTSSPADQPLTQKVDTTTSMYEISVKSVYSVSPLVSLAAVPGLGSVPGLGKPVTLVFSANRPVEHPGGLVAAPVGSAAASVTPFARVAGNPSTTVPPGPSTWRTPDIFTRIRNAGRTIVSINVLEVPAFLPNPAQPCNPWVQTGLTVLPGEQVWLDTQSQGTWGWNYQNLTFDANGSTNYVGSIDGPAADMMLIGWVGGNPPQFPFAGWSANSNPPICPQGGPNFIQSGDTLLNYPVNLPGPISLTCNDDTRGDWGYQSVRIVITR
jgi:Flp pilus assembly protein TadG